MKHTHLFHCEEDQRIQDHKNFMTREIPIQKLLNIENCSNGGKRSSAGTNMMEYDMPELVVFIQEDHHQHFLKDIRANRGVSPECNCLSVDREPNQNLVSFDSNLRTLEAMKIESKEAEDELKIYEGELDVDSGYEISTEQITMKKTVTLREAFRKEEDIRKSFKNWQRNSFFGSIGSKVEFPHFAECVEVTETSISKVEMGNNSQTLTGSSKRQIDFPHQEISSSTVVPLSGPIPTSTGASHQSNDSISSTHSFAFPILPVEWTGSPVRMLEADKSQLRKKRWRKVWFCCQ